MLKDVAYAANPTSPVIRQHSRVIEQELTGLRVTRRVVAGCDGDQGGVEWRPLNSLQASVTREALKDASPVIQRVAGIDEQRQAGAITPSELDVLTSSLTEELARHTGQKLAGALGGQVGSAVARSFTGASGTTGGSPSAQPAQSANPVSRGLKSVGRGIKGLFTKKKDDRP
jgi:hypothetical protein